MLCAALIAGPFTCFAGNEDPSLDALWQRRIAEDAVFMMAPAVGVEEEAYYMNVFRSEVDFTAVLLYTRLAKDLTVERITSADIEEGRYPRYPSEAPKTTNGGVFAVIPEFSSATEACYATGFAENDPQYGRRVLPYLRALIKKYDLTKEELRAACKLSRDDPDALRPLFSAFSDEEFLDMKESEALTCRLDETFLLDALFTKDDRDCAALCCMPYNAVLNGKTIRMTDVLSNKPEIDWAGAVTDETLNASEKNCAHQLLRAAKNYMQSGKSLWFGAAQQEFGVYADRALDPYDERFKLAGETTYRELTESVVPAAKDAVDLALLLFCGEGLPAEGEPVDGSASFVNEIADLSAERLGLDGLIPLREEYSSKEAFLNYLKDLFVDPDDGLFPLMKNVVERDGKLYLVPYRTSRGPVEARLAGRVDGETVRVCCCVPRGNSDDYGAAAAFGVIPVNGRYKINAVAVIRSETNNPVWTASAAFETFSETGIRYSFTDAETVEIADAAVHAIRLLSLFEKDYRLANTMMTTAEPDPVNGGLVGYHARKMDFTADEAIGALIENDFDENGLQRFYPNKYDLPPYGCVKLKYKDFAEIQKIYDRYTVGVNVEQKLGARIEYRDDEGFLYVETDAGVWNISGDDYFDYENMTVQRIDDTHATVTVDYLSDGIDGDPWVGQTFTYPMVRTNGVWKYNAAGNGAPTAGERTGTYAMIALSAVLLCSAALTVLKKKKARV